MKPSVHRKSAIGKRPGWAVHQSDFVRQTTGEGDQLILARHDVAVILGWHISVLPSENYRNIVPRQNQLVAFPSCLAHEITLVDCPSRAFADSRFTVNGWFHR